MTLATVEAMPAARSLGELASNINYEHEQCFLAAVSSLQHAIRAGEALLEAKLVVERGTWERWLDENCPAVFRMARQYMRLASYKDMIPPEVTTAIEAQTALKGLPAFDGSGPRAHPPEVREEALRLVSEGLSRRLVSSMLGVDRKCVDRWAKGVEAPREGRKWYGRPSRERAAERADLIRRGNRKGAIGPLALANGFRDVVEANRADDKPALADSLRNLGDIAVGWAEQLDRRKAH